MSDPLIDPADLGTALNDPSINVARAMDVIVDAQTLCETIISPLPPQAAVVVKRMAKRAYGETASPRQQQIAAAGGQFIGASGPADVVLTPADIRDLQAMVAPGVSAFTMRTKLPEPPVADCYYPYGYSTGWAAAGWYGY